MKGRKKLPELGKILGKLWIMVGNLAENGYNSLPSIHNFPGNFAQFWVAFSSHNPKIFSGGHPRTPGVVNLPYSPTYIILISFFQFFINFFRFFAAPARRLEPCQWPVSAASRALLEGLLIWNGIIFCIF